MAAAPAGAQRRGMSNPPARHLAPLLLAALLSACGSPPSAPEDGGPPRATSDAEVIPAEEADCADGRDEDRDGATDCEDPDCAAACAPPVEQCDNGLDDDGDGWTDCFDEDCPVCPEACGDGADNDEDGRTDCDDEDCAGDPRCPTCGDGVAQADETCDGDDFRFGLTCADFDYPLGELRCTDDCARVDITGCTTHICGNGWVEGPEVCDGDVVRGSCVDHDFDAGELRCADNCYVVDTSACEHVSSRADGTCAAPVSLNAVAPDGDGWRRVTDSNADGGGEVQGSCTSIRGREIVFRYRPPRSGILNWRVYSRGSTDFVTILREGGCAGGVERACSTGGDYARVTAGTTYYLVVDGALRDHRAEFTLEVRDPS